MVIIIKGRRAYKEITKIYRDANKEKINKRGEDFRNSEKGKEYYKDYREKKKEKAKDTTYKRRFGISLEDYNVMFNKQEGKCFICKRHQSEFKKSLAVDHCHGSGRIRKLLCGRCNTTLGLLRENKETLKRMIDYLDMYTNESSKGNI